MTHHEVLLRKMLIFYVNIRMSYIILCNIHVYQTITLLQEKSHC